MAPDNDAIPVNIDSVLDDQATCQPGATKWNIPVGDRPDAETAPTIPLDRPAAEWFQSGFSDE